MLYVATFITVLSTIAILTAFFGISASMRDHKANMEDMLLHPRHFLKPTVMKKPKVQPYLKAREEEIESEVIKNINGRCFVYNPVKKTTRIGCPKSKTIRDFADDAVLCYPEDLKIYNPRCECCGGWILSAKYGLKCGPEISFDCTEKYKETHMRPLTSYSK